MTNIEIDAASIIAKVNPNIYGNFIEFIDDCINKGMWAELLLNRGFENEDSNNDGVSEPWYPTGMNDIVKYSMDEYNSYNSRYSQKIEVVNHYGGYGGIAQGNLRIFNNETYNGYVWVKSSNENMVVEVRIKDKSNKLYYTESFVPRKDIWARYDFKYIACNDVEDGMLELAVHGEGSVWFDQASLMPVSAVDGIWAEVVKAARDLKPSIIRFPGGCFADCYHWMDGIGKRDERPARKNSHWKGIEENNFGTDEFIRFCRNIGSEPMICVNFGSGTPEEAANWVEYCNGSVDSQYGALRVLNGNPEPYNVRYWDIGNEIFAEWEAGHCTAEAFAERYMEFYKAMKAKDSSIIILACGGDGNDLSQEWNKTLLSKTKGKMDYITLHCYAPQIGKIAIDNETLYYGTVGAVKKYEKVINNTYEAIKNYAPEENIKIAVTEWNTMFNNHSYREHTLEAAIFSAGMLNLFLRNNNIVDICNFSDLVNGWQGGCIRSDRGKVFFTPSYYALKLYSNSGAQYVLETRTDCETYDICKVGHVSNIQDVPYVDAVACLGEGEIIIFIVNRHLERSSLVSINVNGANIKGNVFVSEITSANPYDANTMEKEKVKIKDSVIYDFDPAKGFLVSSHSITRLRLPVDK